MYIERRGMKMNIAANTTAAFLKEKNIKVSELREDLLMVEVGFSTGSVKIFVKFNESGDQVYLEGIDFIRVPTEKYEMIYNTLNECNNRYLHVKFVLDTKEGQLSARDDDIIQPDSCGEECFKLIARMARIIEDAYPRFMKALYA